MKGILIEVETEQGKEYKLETKGRTQSTALMNFARKFRRFVNKLEKSLDETKDKAIMKKATFQGSWSYVVLKRITPKLDENKIEWWLDP